jgi:lipopolysaccharide transport system ATP-binding protein
MNLGVGNYSITTSLAGAQSHIEKNYAWKDLAYHFEVIPSDTSDINSYYGNLFLATQITNSHINLPS